MVKQQLRSSFLLKKKVSIQKVSSAIISVFQSLALFHVKNSIFCKRAIEKAKNFRIFLNFLLTLKGLDIFCKFLVQILPVESSLGDKYAYQHAKNSTKILIQPKKVIILVKSKEYQD
eukprot:EC095693.1.p1 GENE.EC095693.1~~EC095693.1.p1  ORF type:complete len:117 (-),score=9.26 EC095693.1:79-429(-)